MHRDANAYLRDRMMIRDHPDAGFWRRLYGSLVPLMILPLVSVAANVIAAGTVGEHGHSLASLLVFLPLVIAYTVIGNGMGCLGQAVGRNARRR